jgi:hypothetical protein
MIRKPSIVDIDTIVQSDGTVRPVEDLGPIPGPPGEDGADSTVPGPPGADSTVPGPQGSPGEDGADGYTPIKGVD